MWRLWNLSPAPVEAMEQLDYSDLFGTAEYNLEVHALLGKIESINWDEIPWVKVFKDT